MIRFFFMTSRTVLCGSILGMLTLAGCAAFHPIEGVPARYVPDEVKAPMRSGKKTIDLSLLSQTQPSMYHLDAGDILAISIEGVMPRDERMLPPVNMPLNGEEALPALGYPVPVRQDGTISLPMLHVALPVRGMTIKQAEDAVRRAYTVDRRILQTGNERVWVILHRPRQYRILVIRQEGVEAPQASGFGAVNLGTLKRGTGRVVTLTAYKNDVLHALAETGGLPGLDAENTIYVIRGKRRSGPANAADDCPIANPPDTGSSAAPNSPAIPGQPSNAAPQLPDPGHSVSPLLNQFNPTSIIPPGSNAPLNPAAPPIHTPADIGAPQPTDQFNAPMEDTAEPQTHLHAPSGNFGLQPAVLGYESGQSPQRVTPMGFFSGIVGRPGMGAPMMTPQPAFNGAAMVPMTAPPMTPQDGWPPVRSAGDLPEMSAENWMGHASFGDPTLANQSVTKIPVRLAPGEQARFTERDIILEDGDIVFIESRDTEIFYTGGLLGGGQYTLPRDYDLDVLGAVAIAQAGRMNNNVTRATGGVTALNNDVTISASQAVILRRMPNGSQVPIKVDLYRALRYPEERVLMQPGDYLMLQYTKFEACGAFIERHLLEGALFGVAASAFNGNR